jgi:hypothetical protein
MDFYKRFNNSIAGTLASGQRSNAIKLTGAMSFSTAC